MSVRFSYQSLSDVIHLAPILAHWATLEWMRDDLVSVFFSERVQSYSLRINPNALPFTLVAFDHELPVGMVSIKENDLPSVPRLSPWMASFYVVSEYRGKGIGSALHDRIIRKALNLGYSDLFLHTYQAANFYKKRGWSVFGSGVTPQGHNVEIFHIPLHSEKMIER